MNNFSVISCYTVLFISISFFFFEMRLSSSQFGVSYFTNHHVLASSYTLLTGTNFFQTYNDKHANWNAEKERIFSTSLHTNLFLSFCNQ